MGESTSGCICRIYLYISNIITITRITEDVISCRVSQECIAESEKRSRTSSEGLLEGFDVWSQVQWVTMMANDHRLFVTVNSPQGVLVASENQAVGQMEFQTQVTGGFIRDPHHGPRYRRRSVLRGNGSVPPGRFLPDLSREPQQPVRRHQGVCELRRHLRRLRGVKERGGGRREGHQQHFGRH